VDVERARLELARRYLHIFAPAQASSFAQWAGISIKEAHNAFSLLKGTITVHTPVGDALILANDEPGFRKKSKPATSIRLLPSGDTYYLLWGAARKLLLPDAKQRTALWTTRVWPGALFMRGEIVGTWRRAAGEVFIETWRRLTSAEREAFEAEALSLPLPGLNRPVAVHFKS
jgi:hypothetical protein